MTRSLHGALLSGLVYPGVGQIAQKHYAKGTALIGIVTASLFVTALTAARRVSTILADIESTGADYDLSTLLKEATRVSQGRDSATMQVASLLVLCCWVFGIVDAYVSGKREDSRVGGRR